MVRDSHCHALKTDFIDLTGGPSITPFDTPRTGSGAQGAIVCGDMGFTPSSKSYDNGSHFH